jgi:O-antigen ligase
VEAHNDYLQLLVEGGWLVTVPALALLGLFAREVRRRFREGRDDRTGYWLRLGAVTGLVAIAFQEIVEFSLQMPGNAAFFTVLCAIAVRRASVKGARIMPPAGSSGSQQTRLARPQSTVAHHDAPMAQLDASRLARSALFSLAWPTRKRARRLLTDTRMSSSAP